MAHTCPRSRRTSGFTLIEILAALAVLSVGITVFVALFSFSLGLAQSSRNQTIAASLAQEKLAALLHNPARYDWHLQNAAPGEQVEVTLTSESAAPSEPNAGKPIRPCTPPTVLPADPRASRHEQDRYGTFSWQAFTKQPLADAAYVEVTVVVRWAEAGRPRLFALTSLAPYPLLASGTPPKLGEGSV